MVDPELKLDPSPQRLALKKAIKKSSLLKKKSKDPAVLRMDLWKLPEIFLKYKKTREKAALKKAQEEKNIPKPLTKREIAKLEKEKREKEKLNAKKNQKIKKRRLFPRDDIISLAPRGRGRPRKIRQEEKNDKKD